MANLNYIAATIMFVLGGLHLVYTLHDLFIRPRYFSPKDTDVLAAMLETRPALSPHARNYWLSVIGFNLSHSLGVLMFALLIALAAAPQLAFLQPLLIAIAAIFALISWHCWFWIPTTGAAITAILLALAWLL